MKPLRTTMLVLTIAAAATGASAQSNPPPGMGPMGSMPMHHPMGGMMGHGREGEGEDRNGEGEYHFASHGDSPFGFAASIAGRTTKLPPDSAHGRTAR